MAPPRKSSRPRPRASSGDSGGISLAAWDDALRRERGVELLGGVDEAGRGALAGPVVAAAVVLAPGAVIEGVDDSKKLSAAEREACVPRVLAAARAWAVGAASSAEVDRIDVLRATHRAMRRALAELAARRTPPQFLVLDHVRLDDDPTPALSIPRADSTSLCVAAASILAKVARDRLMARLDAEFPGYGLAGHKGYGTPAHWAALERQGPSAIHRITFRGVGGDLFATATGRDREAKTRDPDDEGNTRKDARDGITDSPDAISPEGLASLLRG